MTKEQFIDCVQNALDMIQNDTQTDGADFDVDEWLNEFEFLLDGEIDRSPHS